MSVLAWNEKSSNDDNHTTEKSYRTPSFIEKFVHDDCILSIHHRRDIVAP